MQGGSITPKPGGSITRNRAIKPQSKHEGLREFASRGFLLIDATYTPVNHDHLSSAERNKRILDDLPGLVAELREYVGPGTGVVLVKANICEFLEPVLVRQGFLVLNRGEKIPFPSNGQQNRFRAAVRLVLGLGSVAATKIIG
jgi:hypothetical protein